MPGTLRRAGLAVSPDRPPQTAVEVHVVTQHLAGILVRVEVQRPAGVGHLAPTATPRDRSQQGAPYAVAGLWGTFAEYRRPCLGAVAVADALVPAIPLEHVDRLLARVEEHRSEVGAAEHDRGAMPLPGGVVALVPDGSAGRRHPSAAAVITAARQGEREQGCNRSHTVHAAGSVLGRDYEAHPRAALAVGQPDPPAVRLHDRPAKGEPEARPVVALAVARAAHERLEEPLAIRDRKSG